MAGHSHAKNVKRRKDAVNQKKAVVFARISRIIISAVREGGKDPKANSTLRTAIEKGREADMPKENIERAVRRGAGEGEDGKLEPFSFEVYGPDNTAFIIEGSTDNRNRTLGDIKEIVKNNNGKMAESGAVKWLFTLTGFIEIENPLDDEQTLHIIEAGAEDITQNDNTIIYAKSDGLEAVKKHIKEKSISVSTSYLGWRPNTPLQVESEKAKKLLEDLQSNEAVENVFNNL